MSRRRCCCGGSFPDCTRCYTVAFTANFVESANTASVMTSCDLGDGCIGWQNYLTKTWHDNLQRIKAHQYKLVTDAACGCQGPCATVAWEPPLTTFDCEFTWCNGSTACGASGPLLSGSTVWRQKSSTNGSANFAQICCGAPTADCYGFVITFQGNMPSVVLSNASCPYSIVVGPGAPVTWPATYIQLTYCPRPGTNQCVLDLVKVSITPADSLGGGGSSNADCECVPGTGGVSYDVKGTPPTNEETSATGFGPIWALAGAPPLSVTCSCC